MYMRMYIHIHSHREENLVVNLLAVPSNLRNTKRCFQNIFFNNEVIQVHSLPCFLICINSRLTFIILTKSVVALVCKNSQ